MKGKMLLGLLLVSGVASAQQSGNIDCSTVRVGLMSLLQYTVKADFPNPSRDEFKSLDTENVDFNQCGVSITSKGGVTVIKAASIKELLKLVGSPKVENTKFTFAARSISGYKYPALKQDFYYYPFNISVNPDTFEVSTPSGVESYDIAKSLFKSNTVGYKVNGGKIQPYFFDGNITPFKFDAATTNLDFYTKKERYDDGIGRISFDFPNSTITVWKNFDFPAN